MVLYQLITEYGVFYKVRKVYYFQGKILIRFDMVAWMGQTNIGIY